MLSNTRSSKVISNATLSNRTYTNQIHSNQINSKRSHRQNKRRSFAGLITLTLILIVILMLSGIQSADAFKPVSYENCTVVSGDSVWSIASNLNQDHYDGKSDVRKLVYNICEANQLDSPVIHPGQTLQIPLP